MPILSGQQLAQIASLIDRQLAYGRSHLSALDALCDKDYLRGRKEHSVTGLVYGAFPEGLSDIDGFVVRKVKYGSTLALPMLVADSGVCIALYGRGADQYRTTEVVSKVLELGENYRCLEFDVNPTTYRLSRLELVSFDGQTPGGRARITSRKVLLTRSLV